MRPAGWLILAVAAIGLTGCAEMQARQQAEANANAQAQMANDDGQCRSYGTQPGTPAYVQCRMNLDNQHANMEMQRRAILGDYILSR
jgi:outer membrane biogenesis lipoprotein LolB